MCPLSLLAKLEYRRQLSVIEMSVEEYMTPKFHEDPHPPYVLEYGETR